MPYHQTANGHLIPNTCIEIISGKKYVLLIAPVSFVGGAGAQHACLVAGALGIKRVLIHPHASMLSAYGIGLADIRVLQEKTIELPLDAEIQSRLGAVYAELTEQGRLVLRQQGIDLETLNVACNIRVRYAGTDTALEISHAPDLERLRERFETMHHSRFGFADPARDAIVESAVVELIVPMKPPQTLTGQSSGQFRAPLVIQTYFDGAMSPCVVYPREALPAQNVDGPALIIEPNTTIVVEPGWSARLTGSGQLALERSGSNKQISGSSDYVDPVMLEIFNKLFISVAEQMGHTLQNTSYSVNMKERLDFSCAVFDSRGQLVSNAPHMPVHLGSMGDTVTNVIGHGSYIIQTVGKRYDLEIVFMLREFFNTPVKIPYIRGAFCNGFAVQFEYKS